jgi:A/G-specific adenine glycosylase
MDSLSHKNNKNHRDSLSSTKSDFLEEHSPLADVLLAWYDQHKRDLPWRDTTDPYPIWISEIMLQQTRVEQGLAYFFRFMKRFPDLRSVAEASEKEILTYWQGLGYYSRARNIHRAARHIMEQFHGTFPHDYDQILSLPGIGPYTAAAIASFAFQQPYAVVDGNVLRFLTRYFGINNSIDEANTKKEMNHLAFEMMDKQHPDLYNQAIMEFGALQCIPQSPHCEQCPFQQTCFAAANQMVNQYPVKKKKAPTRDRYFYYFCIVHEQNVFLQKRINKDIWQNLYEFPLLESSQPLTVETALQSTLLQPFRPFDVQFTSSIIKHLLSHQTIYTVFFIIKCKQKPFANAPYIAVNNEQLNDYPMPKLIINFINNVLLKQSY